MENGLAASLQSAVEKTYVVGPPYGLGTANRQSSAFENAISTFPTDLSFIERGNNHYSHSHRAHP